MDKVKYTIVYLNSAFDTCIYFGCQCPLDVRLFLSDSHCFGADRVFKLIKVMLTVQNESFDVTEKFVY